MTSRRAVAGASRAAARAARGGSAAAARSRRPGTTGGAPHRPSSSSVWPKFFLSDAPSTKVASIVLPRPQRWRRVCARSIGNLQRVARRRALVEHRRREVGEAGLVERVRVAAGLNTRFAATTGTPCRWLRISVKPLASFADSGVASMQRSRRPAFGGLSRHASSALTDSVPSPSADFTGAGVGTCGPRSGLRRDGMDNGPRVLLQLVTGERLHRRPA